jgi:hypothetical protein
MERVDLISSRPSLALLPLTTDPFLAPVRLDLAVDAPRDSVKVRNNLVDANVEGRFRIGGTIAVPRPAGRIFVERGSIALPTVTMKMEKDSFVEFRPEQPFRPRVDARTTARIGDTRVYLEVSGWLNDLKTKAWSEPPLPERDVLALITTGVTQSDVDPAALGGVAATVVYRQLASELAGKSEEDSFFYDLTNRVELDIDAVPTLTGGEPNWRATIQLLDWLYLSANQADIYNYGMDLILRLTFP